MLLTWICGLKCLSDCRPCEQSSLESQGGASEKDGVATFATFVGV